VVVTPRDDFWTDEENAIADRMWHEGHSFGDIGAALNKSRSAVGGKIRRQGWLKITRPERPPTDIAKPPASKPRKSRKTPAFVAQLPAKKTRKPPVELPVVHDDVRADARMLCLFDLGDSDCRWPIGEPGAKGFGFCGHAIATSQTAPIAPYCEPHLRASRAPTKRPTREDAT
jgi:GcrA cell cycle regulator